MTKRRVIVIVVGIFIALIGFSQLSHAKEPVGQKRTGLTLLHNLTPQ